MLNLKWYYKVLSLRFNIYLTTKTINSARHNFSFFLAYSKYFHLFLVIFSGVCKVLKQLFIYIYIFFQHEKQYIKFRPKNYLHKIIYFGILKTIHTCVHINIVSNFSSSFIPSIIIYFIFNSETSIVWAFCYYKFHDYVAVADVVLGQVSSSLNDHESSKNKV